MLNEELLETKLRSHRGRSDVDRPAIDAIADAARGWIATDNLIKVHRMNPYAVSAVSGIEVERIVPEFLHGVRGHLFDLHWDVHCPHCNGVTEEYDSLADAGAAGSCPMCDVEFDVDFVERVEVSFSFTREILDLQLPPVCEVPESLNAQYLIQGLQPGTQQSGEVELSAGEYQYYCPLTLSKGVLTVRETPTDDEQIATTAEDGAQVLRFEQLDRAFSVSRASARPGRVRFTVQNRCAALSGLILKDNRLGPQLHRDDLPPRLSGLELTHYPVFKRLFGDQAPSERERIKIEAVTVLFTDITGSTEMYERLGDTVAYNIVRDHFEILTEEFEKHGGVVIKTIGDSLMASFTSNTAALAALLPLREKLAEYNRDKPEGKQINIRIGMHRGPAILVNLNGRLDYFGTAINKASRIESVSRSRELSISQEVFEDRRVLDLLKQHGHRELRKRQARLKGLASEQSVYSLRIV